MARFIELHFEGELEPSQVNLENIILFKKSAFGPYTVMQFASDSFRNVQEDYETVIDRIRNA